MTARLGVYGGFILALLTSVTMAQAPKAGVLSAEDLKRIVPTAYFFRGQSASVQLRNSVGFSSSDGKLVLAGRSEEHTSELQSQSNLVCRLLLAKKKQSSK